MKNILSLIRIVPLQWDWDHPTLRAGPAECGCLTEHSKEEWMYGRKGHTDLVDSESWREALDFSFGYITEDVKCNLALLCSILDHAEIRAPIALSLLTLLDEIVGEDFTLTGRTLDRLGLGGMSIDEIKAIFRRGF